MFAMIPRLVQPSLVAGVASALLVSGCTSDAEMTAPGIDTVVVANIEAGMDGDVAECVVGIGAQELSLFVLMPGAERTSAEALLVDELTASCEEASAFVLDSPLEPDTLAFVDQPFTLGDDPTFDRLWEQCDAGEGSACDQLWEKAPVGSDYERFGVTCGDRNQLLDCTEELTGETVEAIDAEAEAKATAKEARDDVADDEPS